jgi:hypothetical protein
MIHYYITDCGAFKVHANYPFPMCIEVNNRDQNYLKTWTKFCNHVENKIEPQYWKSDHIIEDIPKIIINLDRDSDTDSEGDHDSEGETTDFSGVMVLNPFIIKSFISLVLKVLFSRPT